MTEATVTAPSVGADAVSAPVSTPAPAAATFGGKGSNPTTSVDPGKYAIREDYAAALLKEKLTALHGEASQVPSPETEAAAPEQEAAEAVPVDMADEDVTVAVPEQPTPAPASTDPAEEEPFQLEVEAVVTPEVLSQMVTDNPDFAKLLAADSKLKGQLYKTAREAAELKPYREIFPDLDSARAALDHSSTWVDVRETFLGSTTREGTLASLSKIAELSYERDADGAVVLRDGKPVIGRDFFGFVTNVVALDLEHRANDISARLAANQYRSDQDRQRDQRMKDALDVLREETAAASPALEPQPEAMRRRAEELDRRERALEARQQSERTAEYKAFETGLRSETVTRIEADVERILANVERQGGVVSQYLKDTLPGVIRKQVTEKIKANPALREQMLLLERLPVSETSRQRRIAANDRAVQQYLPEIARAELRRAGVQIAQASANRRARVDAQIDSTTKTEPKGSTGPSRGSALMDSAAAFDQAQSEWQRANPGRTFDKVAKELILPRVLQLMTSR